MDIEIQVVEVRYGQCIWEPCTKLPVTSCRRAVSRVVCSLMKIMQQIGGWVLLQGNMRRIDECLN